MATVTLAQCWYFVEDVLRLDAGFDRWHRLSFFIHPILLIICPLINLARFVGRWVLFVILLPFRTVGGAIVLVGRGANKFADQCRNFIVFVAEFYEVPSRASDAPIGGYIVLPFSSGLRVLVLSKEDDDEDDDDDDDYEDCLPLLEGGDEQLVKTFFLLQGSDITSETNDRTAEDASPLLQLATTTTMTKKKDHKAVTQPFLVEDLSFRFHDPVTGKEDHEFTYEEDSRMEPPAEQQDEEEEAEEPGAHVAQGRDVDKRYETLVAAGGDDDEYVTTHVAEVTSPITFRTATGPPGWLSRGFEDKVGVSADTEAYQEEENYSPRIFAESAQEFRHRRRDVEGVVRSHGSGVSQRSLLEDSHGRRKEVEENDRFYGSPVPPRSVPKPAHELPPRKKREVEETDQFQGSRITPQPYSPEAAHVLRHIKSRREVEEVDESRVSPRSVPEVSEGHHEDGNRREVEESDSFYASYEDRVAWFDQLNAERRSIVSAVWNITLGSASLQKSIDSLEFSYRGPAHRKLAKCLESDFEVVYVGQTCLCWEALHYQYRKVENIILSQDPSLTGFDATIAGRFQRFKILLERFVETEKFCGERFWNYAHSRFSTRTLLQVPEVSAYNLRGEQSGEMVTANKLLDAIEIAIRAFWSFLRTDDKKSPSPRILPGTGCPVEDPRDLKLWSQIKNETRKKKVKLKELLKNRKVMSRSGDELQIEMLMSVINLHVVLRVLKMSVITTRQLLFCEEKLKSLRFNQGSLARSTSCCLFPYD